MADENSERPRYVSTTKEALDHALKLLDSGRFEYVEIHLPHGTEVVVAKLRVPERAIVMNADAYGFGNDVAAIASSRKPLGYYVVCHESWDPRVSFLAQTKEELVEKLGRIFEVVEELFKDALKERTSISVRGNRTYLIAILRRSGSVVFRLS
jgi:hypothetical protein